MKKKAALIVCGILAASFAATGVSDHHVAASSTGKESTGSGATLTMSDELKENLENGSTDSAEAASTGSALPEDEAETETEHRSAAPSSAEEESSDTAASGTTAADASTAEGDTGAAEAGTASTEADTADDSTEEADTASTEAAEEASSGAGTAEKDDSASATDTESAYFTLTTPDDWEDHLETEFSEGKEKDSPAYEAAYYEKTAYDNKEGGLLFRIVLCTDRQQYLSLPSYAYLGDLTAEDGTIYAVVAEFPSDVQFSIEAREQYERMSAEVPTVLQSLEAVDGYTFHKGRTRVEQQAEEAYSFASLLDQFRTAGVLPNGTTIDTSSASSTTNQFAILDVDGDGANELVLKIGSPAASDKISRAAAAAEGAEDNTTAATTENADGSEAAGTEAAGTAGTTDTAAAEESTTAETDEAAGAEAVGQTESASDTAAATDEVSAESDAAEDTTGETTTDAGGEDVYTDTFASSNYYVFKGDTSDSHAAHLTMEQVNDLLDNAKIDYISTVYDIGWQNIAKWSVNRLYNEAYVPLGESAERLDARRRHAFKEALQKLVAENELPDGTQALPYEDITTEDMEENDFALADVNADGYDELLIRVTNTDAGSSHELVYAYDAESGELRLEFDGVPGGVVYYDNGTLKAEARYDNNEPSRLWPYQLAAFNSETGAYESQGYVYAWDQDVMLQQQGKTVDALAQGFPTDADADGNGRVFFLQDRTTGTENADTDAVDDEVVSGWYESVVSSSSEEVYVFWEPVREDNIGTALERAD